VSASGHSCLVSHARDPTAVGPCPARSSNRGSSWVQPSTTVTSVHAITYDPADGDFYVTDLDGGATATGSGSIAAINPAG
jgi:hypothetical protein